MCMCVCVCVLLTHSAAYKRHNNNININRKNETVTDEQNNHVMELQAYELTNNRIHVRELTLATHTQRSPIVIDIVY